MRVALGAGDHVRAPISLPADPFPTRPEAVARSSWHGSLGISAKTTTPGAWKPLTCRGSPHRVGRINAVEVGKLFAAASSGNSPATSARDAALLAVLYGLGKLAPHSLRRSFATQLLSGGNDLAVKIISISDLSVAGPTNPHPSTGCPPGYRPKRTVGIPTLRLRPALFLQR